MEAPCVEFYLPVKLGPDSRLEELYFPLFDSILEAFVDFGLIPTSLEHDFLIVEVDIELEHVVSRQLLDLLLVLADLVLNPYHL